ncbi:hypothetical protein FB45DRAFT_1066185 [Roridomyces roridus]|uniref:Uncharacterized protein n=1 Tax=Roridomyces roridus TaxID=1738132 RepID=A0AAD7B4I6_9AGAR|nr:hypothetical protein FB45DRAFT_1066185 [Roridomyces roridus]
MAQLSTHITELEKRTSRRYKTLIDPLHSNYVALMEAILAAHETCARYLCRRRTENEQEQTAAALRTFSERLKGLETPIADLRGGWKVAARSLSAEVQAYGATFGEKITLWCYPDTMKHWSLDELSAQVATANNHLDLLLEAYRSLALALAEAEGIWALDECPQELHENIGIALKEMINLDQILVSYRTHTVRAHGIQWSDERLCATPLQTLLATEERGLLMEYSTMTDWLECRVRLSFPTFICPMPPPPSPSSKPDLAVFKYLSAHPHDESLDVCQLRNYSSFAPRQSPGTLNNAIDNFLRRLNSITSNTRTALGDLFSVLQEIHPPMACICMDTRFLRALPDVRTLDRLYATYLNLLAAMDKVQFACAKYFLALQHPVQASDAVTAQLQDIRTACVCVAERILQVMNCWEKTAPALSECLPLSPLEHVGWALLSDISFSVHDRINAARRRKALPKFPPGEW